MTSPPKVLYELREMGRVALVTINRPERANALDEETAHMLYDCYDRAHADKDVRVVVVTGAGRQFCGGADAGILNKMAEVDDGTWGPSGRSARLGQGGEAGKANSDFGVTFWGPGRVVLHPSLLPKPVICAVNGYCGGLGLSVALACDIIFASEQARFAVVYPRRALIAEHGVSHMLPRAIGQKNAMMLMLQGDPIDAKEAYRLGLVQRLFSDQKVLVEEALRFANDLATNVPASSLAVVKQQARHHPLMPELQALHQSHHLMEAEPPEANIDFKEAMTSLGEKRQPSYSPYSPDRGRIKLMQVLFGPDEFRSRSKL